MNMNLNFFAYPTLGEVKFSVTQPFMPLNFYLRIPNYFLFGPGQMMSDPYYQVTRAFDYFNSFFYWKQQQHLYAL